MGTPIVERHSLNTEGRFPYPAVRQRKRRLAVSIWISKLLGPVILALSIPMIATPAILQETSNRSAN